MSLQFLLTNNTSQPSLISFNIAHVAFGEFPSNAVSLIQAVESSNNDITPVIDSTQLSLDKHQSLILVAFQLDPATDKKNALKQYSNDRQPFLEKHGGRVYLNAITQRNERWIYDGFELIQFPLPDSVQALMQDSNYTEATKISGKAFTGAFAMAMLDVLN